jgi:pimeloyl-ACP methyl ester carboxylesterase
MDSMGFGDSEPLPAGTLTIERLAAAAHEVLVALGHRQTVIVGHHTGAAIATEIAAAIPTASPGWCLSASPYVDAARRAAAHGRHIIDDVTPRADGGHLAELWAMRQPFYPRTVPNLLERFVVDALKAGPLAAEGHRMVDRYEMDKRLPLVRCPTLVIARRPTRMPIRMHQGGRRHPRQRPGRDRKRHGAAARPDAAGIRRRGPSLRDVASRRSAVA